jgi:NUMOD3 motif
MAKKSCVVYWLHDSGHTSPEREGYVGVTTNLPARLKQHRNDKRKRKGALGVPKIFEHKILLQGTLAECLALEKRLRPEEGTGWNFIRGGRQGWLSWRPTEDQRKRLSKSKKGQGKGRKHTPEAIENMRRAQKAHFANPQPTAFPIAEYWRGKDRSGPNNPRFRATVSDETRAKIGKANTKRVCRHGHDKEVDGPVCPKCAKVVESMRRSKAKHLK